MQQPGPLRSPPVLCAQCSPSFQPLGSWLTDQRSWRNNTTRGHDAAYSRPPLGLASRWSRAWPRTAATRAPGASRAHCAGPPDPRKRAACPIGRANAERTDDKHGQYDRCEEEWQGRYIEHHVATDSEVGRDEDGARCPYHAPWDQVCDHPPSPRRFLPTGGEGTNCARSDLQSSSTLGPDDRPRVFASDSEWTLDSRILGSAGRGQALESVYAHKYVGEKVHSSGEDFTRVLSRATCATPPRLPSLSRKR